jgi:hypothetical protein
MYNLNRLKCEKELYVYIHIQKKNCFFLPVCKWLVADDDLCLTYVVSSGVESELLVLWIFPYLFVVGVVDGERKILRNFRIIIIVVNV